MALDNMKYAKFSDGSFMHNCRIQGRVRNGVPSGCLFSKEGGSVTVRLNGYAVIPLEEYMKLKGEQINPETMAEIEEAEKQLRECKTF